MSSHVKITETLNNNYRSIIKEHTIKVTKGLQCGISNIENPMDRSIEKCQSHLSIEKRKETLGKKALFLFIWFLVFVDTIFRDIVSLGSNEATYINDVPTNIVKASVNLPLHTNF